MWDLPGPGIVPVSLSLQGRFLTTGPLRKSPKLCLSWSYWQHHCSVSVGWSEILREREKEEFLLHADIWFRGINLRSQMKEEGITFQYSRQCHTEKGIDMWRSSSEGRGQRMRTVEEQILTLSLGVPSPRSFSHRWLQGLRSRTPRDHDLSIFQPMLLQDAWEATEEMESQPVYLKAFSSLMEPALNQRGQW